MLGVRPAKICAQLSQMARAGSVERRWLDGSGTVYRRREWRGMDPGRVPFTAMAVEALRSSGRLSTVEVERVVGLRRGKGFKVLARLEAQGRARRVGRTGRAIVWEAVV